MVQYEFEETFNGNYANFRESWLRENLAEPNLPLRASKMPLASSPSHHNLLGGSQSLDPARARQISNQVILINLVALLVNLLLAIIGFYLSFTQNSTAASAFAADCVLDLLSSAILLWRYYGDLSSLYMHAREQIACIYLGCLFEISSIGIIIKSVNDMFAAEPGLEMEATTLAEQSYALVYLAVAATFACSVLTVFKCHLYKLLRDKSILLDVVNTLISTVFALSIVMSQALINVNPTFWYLDPILSIVLAVFMMAFGIKVIHQNFQVLKPSGGSIIHDDRSYYRDTSLLLASTKATTTANNRGSTNYSTITFQ